MYITEKFPVKYSLHFEIEIHVCCFVNTIKAKPVSAGVIRDLTGMCTVKLDTLERSGAYGFLSSLADLKLFHSGDISNSFLHLCTGRFEVVSVWRVMDMVYCRETLLGCHR
jgi:hypothetical protein